MKFGQLFCWIVLLLVLNFVYLSVVEALLWSQFTLMQVRINRCYHFYNDEIVFVEFDEISTNFSSQFFFRRNNFVCRLHSIEYSIN